MPKTATREVLAARDEALGFLREAKDALVQARARMCDAGIDGYTVPVASGHWFHAAARDIERLTKALIVEVEAADCSECCQPLHDGPCAPEVTQ